MSARRIQKDLSRSDIIGDCGLSYRHCKLSCKSYKLSIYISWGVLGIEGELALVYVSPQHIVMEAQSRTEYD